MPRTAVSGALAFTVNSSGAADGNAAQVELISDGANVPTFTGMAEWGTSFGYDNSQAGLRNLIQFFRSGGAYYYSISQPAVNTPIDLVAPTAGTATVENATATVINLVISEAADTSAAPSAASFAVTGHTVSSVAWGTSTRLDITVTPAFVNGEAARTLAYTPGTNPIKDVAGNLMAAFSGKAITNNVGSSVEPEVTAWLARVATAGGTVSAGTQTAVNNFVVSAKANGYWSTFQRLNLFCGDQAASLVPLVNTVGSTADTNTGTTYAESTGPVTNGTSQYISTGLTPSASTGGISLYLRTTQTSNATTRIAIGCRDSGSTQVFRLAGNTAGDGAATSGAVSGSWGGQPGAGNVQAATTGGFTAAMWHIVRTSSTLATLYKNGTSVGTGTTSTSPSSSGFDLRLFGSNPAGAATNAYLESGSAIGAYGVDSGMTGTQAGNYRTDMQTFQAALSRSV